MDNDNFSQGFGVLGIPIQPLPANYTPDEFGHMLIAMAQTEQGVSYAASTDYKPPQNASDTSEQTDKTSH